MEAVRKTISVLELRTPSLLLDADKLDRNISRMTARIARMGGALRPHVKTNKSLEVTRLAVAELPEKKICVSTLKEADFFFRGGIIDITYAVGIAPCKLDEVARLIKLGAQISIVLDSMEVAVAVAAYGHRHGITFRAYIELDLHCGRSGVRPKSPELLDIAKVLHQQPVVEFLGVLSHAGQSYDTATTGQIEEIAEYERSMSVAAAEYLRQAGFPCNEISIGSTPTALFFKTLEGVTEVRAGVYVFNDLFQVGLGVCGIDDIALSVLATVIGHNAESRRLVVDAGWMALSQDRGTAKQKVDQGYGLVIGPESDANDGLLVLGANQEHGMVGHRDPLRKLDFSKYPLGSKIRILPNHACATAAQHDSYVLVSGDKVLGEWPRIRGW